MTESVEKLVDDTYAETGTNIANDEDDGDSIIHRWDHENIEGVNGDEDGLVQFMSYLVVSREQRKKDLSKPYDPTRSCWVCDKNGEGKDTFDFKEGIVVETETSKDGEKTVSLIEGSGTGDPMEEKRKTVVLPEVDVRQVNPPKFERCEDMSDLTYLNDASVLHNLRSRYDVNLIYTYSGLFCVAVNPYSRFPIYNSHVVKLYVGSRRTRVPPHIYSIADEAYQNVMAINKNQSIMVTGESGAGKTENTKKVIGYFASVCSRQVSSDSANRDSEACELISLEDQVVQTNPVLEAFGNAKTVRNDNSSRFGKFIRIHFDQNGKLSGADIEVYLLEKSRITYQQQMERSFHIFYCLMSGQLRDIREMCHLSDNILDYTFFKEGTVNVDSLDDISNMEGVDRAFDILGFSKQQKEQIYMVTAVVMHLGQLRFKAKSSKDEQAIPQSGGDDTSDMAAKHISQLLGILKEDVYSCFTSPKIKVGSEWVTKGQNVGQAMNAVSATARVVYEKLFRYIVYNANMSLYDENMRRINYIGVLDIAGFEIFDCNGFEQLCINFCNEKLQQFFNHHMFIVEQDEYLQEGIDWAVLDFGMDLQKCIDMFEKPLGILSILEEESLFPRATDKSFEEKLKVNLLGKCPMFLKPKSKVQAKQKKDHFAVVHYAGVVSYNITDWLEKNKDPVNDSVVEILRTSTNKVMVDIFDDKVLTSHFFDEGVETAAKALENVMINDLAPTSLTTITKKRKKKKPPVKTVSAFYRDQLNNLMRTLRATDPQFIRCIVPNVAKKRGVFDYPLVMHQLRCNGVLEGIRICRKGFPSKIFYTDFISRYGCLHMSSERDKLTEKDRAWQILKNINLEEERYRLGYTKVFFRASIVGYLEELRAKRITRITCWIQATARGYLARNEFEILKLKKLALKCVQRTLRRHLRCKQWSWWVLWANLKPKLRTPQFAALRISLKSKIESCKSELLEIDGRRMDDEDERDDLMKQIEELRGQLEILDCSLEANKEIVNKMDSDNDQIRVQINSTQREKQEIGRHCEVLNDEVDASIHEIDKLKSNVVKLNDEITAVNCDIDDLENVIHETKKEIEGKDNSISKLVQSINDCKSNVQKIELDTLRNDGTVESCKKEERRLKIQNDEKEDKLAKLKQTNTSLERRREDINDKLSTLRDEIDKLGVENTSVDQSMSETEQLMKTTDQKMKIKLDDLKQCQIRLRQTENNFTALTLEYHEDEMKYKMKRRNVARSNEELMAIQRDLNESEIEFEQKKNVLVERKRELKEVTEALELRKSDLDEWIDCQGTKHVDKVKKMEHEMNVLVESLSRYESQELDAANELSILQVQFKETSIREKELILHNRNLKDSSTEKSDDLVKLEKTLNTQSDDLRMAKRRQSDLSTDIDNKTETVSNFNRNLKCLRSKLKWKEDQADELKEKIKSLNENITEGRVEIDCNRRKMDDDREANLKLASTLKDLKEEYRQLELIYKSDVLDVQSKLDQDISKLTCRIQEGNSCMSEMKELVVKKEHHISKLEGKRDMIDEAMKNGNNLKCDINCKIGHQNKAKEEFVWKIKEAKSHVLCCKEKCQDVAERINLIETDINKNEQSIDQCLLSKHTLEDEFKRRVLEVEKTSETLKDVQHERNRKKADRDASIVEQMGMKSRVEELKLKVKERNADFINLRRQCRDEVDCLNREFESDKINIKLNLASLESSVEVVEKQCASSLGVNETLQREISELEITLDSVCLAKKALNEEERAMKDDLKVLNEEIDKVLSCERSDAEKCRALQLDVKHLKRDIEVSQDEIVRIQREIDSHEANICTVKEEMVRAKNENKKLVTEKCKLDLTDATILSGEVDDHKVKLKSLKQKLQAAKCFQVELASNFEVAAIRLKHLQSQLTDLKEKKIFLKTDVAGEKRTTSITVEQENRLKEKIDQLNDELSDHKMKRLELNKERKRLRSKKGIENMF